MATKTRTNINLTAQQHAWFGKLAEKTGISKSELIRRALDTWRTQVESVTVEEPQETPEQTYFRLALGFHLAIDQQIVAAGQGPLEPGHTIEGYSADGYKLRGTVTGGGPVAQVAIDIWRPDGSLLEIDKQRMAEVQATMIRLHEESKHREN